MQTSSRRQLRTRTQSGIAHLLLLVGIAAITLGTAGIGLYSHFATENQKSSVAVVVHPDVHTTSQENTTAVSPQQSVPVTATPSVATPHTSPAPTRPVTITPTPVPTPTPVAAPTPAVTISADGCTITAVGVTGLQLQIDVHNTRKGGGATYTVPASNGLTVHSGGIQGMTVIATLTNPYGTLLGKATGTITAAACPVTEASN